MPRRTTETAIEAALLRMRDMQREHIERHGRTLVGVFPNSSSSDPTNDSYVYTIGNTLKDLPELLIVGLQNDLGILNALSEEMIRRGEAFADREVYLFPGSKAPVCIVDAAESVKDRYTLQVGRWFERYRVQQVVVSDEAGLLPWQAGCAKPYRDVVVHRARPLNS